MMYECDLRDSLTGDQYLMVVEVSAAAIVQAKQTPGRYARLDPRHRYVGSAGFGTFVVCL
jgi:hypothetical protein